ncbi:Oidioi.mRNA.OKI2018_I69.chr1.g3441.t1.cds [Oikopleura dioica]|uniref:Oidioi.mRNA.OKI2018_I69.chr1.g3441.t1.cds n=1 Tax=Oikopleura dioica TaxID=34765 RepID=A0ABN7SU60_OIKDI|nr:Oidioi.mRNA.OKI2018_I69.chr1.g3441.t1.cds [Oikopleura dioica]
MAENASLAECKNLIKSISTTNDLKVAMLAANTIQKCIDDRTCKICSKEFDPDVIFRQRAYISNCSHQFCYGCLAEEAGNTKRLPLCQTCSSAFALADVRILKN